MGLSEDWVETCGAGRVKYENVQGQVISRRKIIALIFRTGLLFLFADFMQILHFAGESSLFFYRAKCISLIPAVFFICESLFLYRGLVS